MINTFPPNKTAEELGIDKSREFIVVVDTGRNLVMPGDVLTLSECGHNWFGTFINKRTGRKCICHWSELAYADDQGQLLGYDQGEEGGDETVAMYGRIREDGSVELTSILDGLPVEEPYVPRVGDRVSLEGEVVQTDSLSVQVRFGEIGSGKPVEHTRFYEKRNIKLLSRKSPRKVTRAELEKILGGEFELID